MQRTIGLTQLVDMIARDVHRNEGRYQKQDRAALRKAVSAILWQANDILEAWSAEACKEMDAVREVSPEIGDVFEFGLLSDHTAACDLVLTYTDKGFRPSFQDGPEGNRGGIELEAMLAAKMEARALERGMALSEAADEVILRDWLSNEPQVRFVALFQTDSVLEAAAERERTFRMTRRSSVGLGNFLIVARLGIDTNHYNIRALQRIVAPPKSKD